MLEAANDEKVDVPIPEVKLLDFAYFQTNLLAELLKKEFRNKCCEVVFCGRDCI